MYSLTVRLTLAVSVIAAWCRLRNTLQKQFGNTFAWWYTLITVTQYHFMFYMSRPLPNIMVIPLGKLCQEFSQIYLAAQDNEHHKFKLVSKQTEPRVNFGGNCNNGYNQH